MNPDGARRKLNHAVKGGLLVRPTSCERCGETPPPASDGRASIQAHHHDYSKPLDVEWICAKCHRKETPLPARMGAPVYGERNGQAKMSAEKIKDAKALRESGLSYEQIAKLFGVHHSTIQRALTGKHWLAAAQKSKP